MIAISNQFFDWHVAVLADVESCYTELSEPGRKFHFNVPRPLSYRFFMQFFDAVSLICHYHYQWSKGDELKRNKVVLEEHVAIVTQLFAHNTSGVLSAMETHLNTAKKNY
ncbi:MAG: hypothetical protein MJK15_18035 [Colwellia sp.]|nr:hypothetical protein [Colwellia sp.]